MGMDFNVVAILAAAIASFVAGMLWYGPLFGKQWMKLARMTPEKMNATAMAIAFASNIVVAYVLSYFVDVAGAVDAVGGAIVGFWVWLGFIATLTLGGVLWEGKSTNLYLFNNAYHIVNFLLMGAVVAVL